jgi:hypothetical protein
MEMERIIVWGGRRVCILAEAFEGVFQILKPAAFN